jgi:hypothetical protein
MGLKMKDETLGEITVCTDTETGIESIGEFDSGLFEGKLPKWVHTHCERNALLREAARLVDKIVIATTPTLIFVNGKEKTFFGRRIDYHDLCRLAGFLVGTEPTITYRNGPLGNIEGTLGNINTVSVCDNMIFDVADTSGA